MIPIEAVLDKYGVEYRVERDNNQQVKCPFHDDGHASASVNLGKGLFNCFTCDVSGDAIEILKRVEGLDFVEAKRVAEELARDAGPAVSRELDAGDSFLPRRAGSRPERRNWSPPWSRRGA